MNLVGKIFTFLVFLMCVVFATFAMMVHAGQKNWREVVVNPSTGLSKQLTDEKALKQKLEGEKKTLEESNKLELDRRDKRAAALETQNQLLAQERKANDFKIVDLEKQVRDMVGAVKAVHLTLAELRVEADSMRKQIKDAELARNDSFTKLVAVTDQFHNAVTERLRLEKMNRGLSDEVVKLREALAYYKVSADGSYKDKVPPRLLEGEVTSASNPNNIEISIGADDGVLKGHKFEVVRLSNKSYVARIEVIDASFPNRAVCRPDASMQRSQIQKGDHVYANLTSAK